ncbi:competence protein ComEC [uncultured Pseudodesulfovibrio sp.]|uniref:competence protein ComEC n=1 Tax=uncultured Pseudodesulfovibrio sp. TaxID=2035858 RepID=UPI0029C6C78C|nr:competence protein ComEC [uncultured Pseudodesulfovibrio sp.]
MTGVWISDPIFWLIALPALAVSGLLMQMVLSLFRCCASFTLRGKPIQLKWWMIPATSCLYCLVWGMAIAYAVFFTP